MCKCYCKVLQKESGVRKRMVSSQIMSESLGQPSKGSSWLCAEKNSKSTHSKVKDAYSGRKQTLDVGHLRRQERPHAVGVVSFHACRHAQWLSHVPLSGPPWTVACQAPLPMEFCRQQYWSGLPIPSPGDLPAPVIELASPALASGFSTSEPPRKPNYEYIRTQIALICKVSTLSSGPPVDSRVELEKS